MLIKPSLSMSFNPAAWVTTKANCYSYALNVQKNIGLNLGHINLDEETGLLLSAEEASNTELMRQRALRDGLIPINEHSLDPSKNHILAIFCGVDSWKFDSGDFHLYRLDGDNLWSHKPGKFSIKKVESPASSQDLLRHYKSSILEARMVGFFQVPPEGLVCNYL